MNKFIYFETGSNDAIMFPIESYLGAKPRTDSTFDMRFKKIDNALDVSKVAIEHDPGMTTEAMQSVHEAMAANPKDGFIVIGDDNDPNFTNLEHITGIGNITE